MSTPRWMQGKPVEEKQKPRWMQGRAVDGGPLARNTAMDLAAERANAAYRSNQPISPDDLAHLGRLDFSPAAMSRLPPVIPNAQAEEEGQAWLSAMEKGGKEKRAYDAAVRQEKMMRQLPDSDFKERLIIAMNVPTYGSGPRLAAGAQTVGALLATPFVEDDIIDREGVSGAMSQFLDEARTHQRRGRTERPAESIGIEVVPSLFQGKTMIDTLGKRVLPGTSTLSNVSRVAGVGTGYGALYAGSQNESGTVEGVARDAAVGGALGAGFGLGFKAAEPAVTAGYRSAKTGAATISDALSELLGKAGGARDKVAQEVALAAVRRSMERSGMTFDQIMELVKRYEGKPAVLAEVIGQDAVNALTALTRRPGSTPQKAQDIIEERFFERPARMAADVEEATGIQIGQLDSTLDAQLIARQEAAKPIYDALYKQYSTIKSFGESLKRINRLARTPAMQKHLTLAEEAVKTQAALRQVPVSKMSKMEYWDLVKRSLDDEINSAVAKGEARTKVGASVADLTQLKSAITDEFDRLTDGAYAAARQAGGEAPRLRAAAVAGQKALGARNARETAKTVAATLPQDVAGFRAGVVDDLGTRIERGMVPGRVRLPDVANKLRAALGDEPANRIISRFDAEANLAESGANWAPRMKSPTGTVMESGPSAFGDDLVNAGMNLATGNKLGLLRQAINFMRQRGFSQRQIDAIGDLLLSSPEEGLRRLQVIKPEGPPAGLAAPVAGGPPSGGQPPAAGTPPAGGSASGRTVGKGKLGTRTADAAAIAMLATGGPTAEADTGGAATEADTSADPKARIAELSQSQASAQQQITEYEQGLKDFKALPVTEKQRFLKENGFLGSDGKPLVIDGRPEGNTAFAIKAYEAQTGEAIAAAKAERETFRKDINDIRVALAQKPEKQTNPLIDKLTEYGTYGAAAYLAHRGRGAMVKGSQVTANRAAAKANALLTRLPVPPEAPRKTLVSRVPILGDKQKARIKRETTAANKAQFATEERLSGRDIPPISSNPTSPDGLPVRLANVDEFDRQAAAGDFGPVSRIGRFMEPVNSRFRGSDLAVISTGAADTYITEGMIQKTREDIVAEEKKLAKALADDDPDAIGLSTTRLEQLRQAETVQLILQRIGIGMMIGGGFGLTHGRYARPQPRYEAAARERDLINRAMAPAPAAPPPAPPAPLPTPAPAPAPAKPRTVGKPKPKPLTAEELRKLAAMLQAAKNNKD